MLDEPAKVNDLNVFVLRFAGLFFQLLEIDLAQDPRPGRLGYAKLRYAGSCRLRPVHRKTFAKQLTLAPSDRPWHRLPQHTTFIPGFVPGHPESAPETAMTVSTPKPGANPSPMLSLFQFQLPAKKTRNYDFPSVVLPDKWLLGRRTKAFFRESTNYDTQPEVVPSN